MSKKTVGCLVAAGILGLFMFVMFFLLIVTGMSSDYVHGDKIAHIDLEGIITSQAGSALFGGTTSMTERFKKHLKKAVEDDEVKAIVVRINSPGGEITASDTIYHAVTKAKEKKPVVVFMDSLAASGGYYVACAANEIIANETTLTGSIGVIIQTLNYYELFNKVGLEALVFKSGQLKDALSGARELTPEEEAYIQSMVDQMYDRFLEIVSSARGISKQDLRDGIADGRVLSGKDALGEDLIDATGYIEDAFDRARDLGASPEAKVYRYRSEPGLMDILGGAGASMAGGGGTGGRRLEIDLSDRLLPRLNPGMIYLLPSYYVP